jgi:hypothetical protein
MLHAKWLMPLGFRWRNGGRQEKYAKVKSAIRGEMALFFALGSGPGIFEYSFYFLPSQIKIIRVEARLEKRQETPCSASQ